MGVEKQILFIIDTLDAKTTFFILLAAIVGAFTSYYVTLKPTAGFTLTFELIVVITAVIAAIYGVIVTLLVFLIGAAGLAVLKLVQRILAVKIWHPLNSKRLRNKIIDSAIK